MDDKSGLNEKFPSQDNMDSTEPPSPSSDNNHNKDHPIRKTEVEDPQIIHIGTGSESDGSEDATELDPFVPFPEMHIEEGGILTVRAIVVGCLLGALVNASNTYLGLKTGWGFPVNLFGAILGYAILKSMSTTFPNGFPILGGKFGPKENAIVQTSATAAGGLSAIFVSAVPALYQLKLLGDGPEKDFPRLLTFTIVSAYYGLFFATPLRKYFIVHMARELNLIFPTATATALSIKSMHAAGGAAGRIATKKSRSLIVALFAAIVLRVVSQYAPGILWDWHIFSWFFVWGKYNNAAIVVDNWRWVFQWSPAFIGTGMLAGMNTAVSFFGGNILAYAIIGPVLVKYGAAFGKPMIPEGEPGYEKWGKMVNYISLTLKDPKNAPSPRYWLLWPGVAMMVAASFAEIGVQWRFIGIAIQTGFKGTCGFLEKNLEKFGKESAMLQRASQGRKDMKGTAEDPFPKDQQVKSPLWSIPLIITIIFTCVILALQYQLPVGLSILTVVLGFFFAFLSIQATGTTDITPTTATAKASQFVLGGATATTGSGLEAAQRLNIIGGAVAIGAAQQATDLVMDFRVGFLLRTPPVLQWYAQVVGTIVAIFLAPGMFVLFTKAYPCMLDLTAEVCPFAVPSAASWRVVTIAVTDPSFPIPKSSWVFSIIISIIAIATVIFRHNVLVGERAKYRVYMPNYMAIGLAFVLPTTSFGNAIMFGAIIGWLWNKKWPGNYEIYCYAIAAGGIAGEGLGGCINALFQVLNIAGDKYGTAIGCPGDSYCG